MRRLLACAAAAALLAGCGGSSPTEPEGSVRDAPVTVVVDGRTLFLETSLWRDFQQIGPPEGRGLAAVVRVKTADGGAFPAKVAADTVWVFNGDASWVPPFEVVATSAPWLELAMRDGPLWGPGIAVDVVVRLRDAAGAPHLVQAKGQPIIRVD